MLNHYKEVKHTQKEHDCCKCSKAIPIGNKAISGVTKVPFVNKGKFTSGYFHENCAASLSLSYDTNCFMGSLSLSK